MHRVFSSQFPELHLLLEDYISAIKTKRSITSTQQSEKFIPSDKVPPIMLNGMPRFWGSVTLVEMAVDW